MNAYERSHFISLRLGQTFISYFSYQIGRLYDICVILQSPFCISEIILFRIPVKFFLLFFSVITCDIITVIIKRQQLLCKSP